MTNLAIQFLKKKITKGSLTLTKKYELSESSKHPLMRFYICKIKHIKYTYEERTFPCPG